MILYIEDILREVDILNWYKGEAKKHGDSEAVVVQSDADSHDAILYHLRNAVTDVLMFANANRVWFTCEQDSETLVFSLSPIREGREYLLGVLRDVIRQYLVCEVRRLWMMNIREEWADSSQREALRENIRKAMNDVTAMGTKVRRRYAPFGI